MMMQQGRPAQTQTAHMPARARQRRSSQTQQMHAQTVHVHCQRHQPLRAHTQAWSSMIRQRATGMQAGLNHRSGTGSKPECMQGLWRDEHLQGPAKWRHRTGPCPSHQLSNTSGWCCGEGFKSSGCQPRHNDSPAQRFCMGCGGYFGLSPTPCSPSLHTPATRCCYDCSPEAEQLGPAPGMVEAGRWFVLQGSAPAICVPSEKAAVTWHRHLP